MAWGWLLVGMFIGALGIIVLMVYVMRTRMIVEYRSNRSFEDTCRMLEETVGDFKKEGWGFPIPKWHFFETFKRKNLVPKDFRKLMVYFVCNAAMASKVISADRKMVGIMPCGWAVYELADGSVWLAKMNVGLMAHMFSGVVKEQMLIVEEADSRMLPRVLGTEGERQPVSSAA